MLRIYSIKVSNDNDVISAQSEILDDLLPFIITWTFWSDINENYNRSDKMLDNVTLCDTAKYNRTKCYFTS